MRERVTSTEVAFLLKKTMIAALLGTKIDQTQRFTQEGKRLSVTLISAGPCVVTKIMTAKENSSRVQLGFGITRHLNRPMAGQLKQAGIENKPRFLREFKLETPASELKLGQEIKISEVFNVGDRVRVTGTSKGKGFAGVVKRHGFAGGPRTHGQSDRERAPGSIGQTTTPGRVYRGKRMAGRLGGERVTVTGLKVVSVDSEKNILTVSGLVPGPKNGLLIIQKEK